MVGERIVRAKGTSEGSGGVERNAYFSAAAIGQDISLSFICKRVNKIHLKVVL